MTTHNMLFRALTLWEDLLETIEMAGFWSFLERVRKVLGKLNRQSVDPTAIR